MLKGKYINSICLPFYKSPQSIVIVDLRGTTTTHRHFLVLWRFSKKVFSNEFIYVALNSIIKAPSHSYIRYEQVLGVLFMRVFDKIENLVFEAQTVANVELVKDRIVVIKTSCEIKHLTDTSCYLLAKHKTLYKIFGSNLQVREYGENYIKLQGDTITSLVIENGGVQDE